MRAANQSVHGGLPVVFQTHHVLDVHRVALRQSVDARVPQVDQETGSTTALVDAQMRAVVLPGRRDLVGHQIAGPDGPLLVDLQGGVVSGTGEVSDQNVVQPKRRRVHDAPVADASQDARQKLGLTLAHGDRAVQELSQQPQEGLGEPPVERPAPNLGRPVLQVRAKHVVLSFAFVSTSSKDQCHDELEDVELPFTLLDTILVRELVDRVGAQRFSHMLPERVTVHDPFVHHCRGLTQPYARMITYDHVGSFLATNGLSGHSCGITVDGWAF